MILKFEKLCLAGLVTVLIAGCSKPTHAPKVSDKPAGNTEASEPETAPEIDIAALRLKQRKKFKTTGELKSPVRLEADGEVIDISLQQLKTGGCAHAGPTIADVDGDGDSDLLVGDFPGYFWFFENENDDSNPSYVAKGKLQAGGEDARTPVY